MAAAASLLLIQSVVLAAVVRPGAPKTCYQTSQNPFALFGTKTTYGTVSGNELHSPPECRAMQLWLVSRHGTRYPSREKIEELKGLERFKDMITADTTMCPEDIKAIRDWKPLNLTKDDHYMLQRQGFEELKSLAARLKRMLPQLFNTAYDDKKFKFLTSAKPRAKDSAIAFFQSMFNQKPEKELPIAQHSDDRLSLSKCKHIQNDDDNEQKYGEAKLFEEGPYVQSVVSRVSAAMGLKQNLSYENVSLIMESCKYDKAWYIQSRPAWCAVFTETDFEIFEYLEDLKYYYTNGYGNPNSKKMGCPIVKDLMDNFKNLARDKTGPLGIFYFGHSPNVLSVVTKMGIGQEKTPLLSTNFEQMKSRKWRTSYIDPFASNVMAVFFRCRDGNKALILLNEHAIPMTKDNCRVCPWEQIEAQYDSITSDNNTCNLDFCNSSSPPSFDSTTTTIVTAVVMFIISILNDNVRT